MADSTLDCIDIVGSYPREEVINRFAHAAFEKYAGPLTFTNIEVECTEHHEDLDLSREIQLVILTDGQPEDDLQTLPLHREKTAGLRWRGDDPLSILPSATRLTVIAQSEELGDIGCFSITLEGLHALQQTTTAINEHIVRESELDSENGFPIMKLAADVLITPVDVEGARKYINALRAYHFSSIFERTGDIEDIDQAIDAQTGLVDATPIGDEQLPRLLDDLSHFYRDRFEKTRDFQDAKKALAVQRRAVHFAEGQADLASVTGGLGVAYLTYFHATKRLSDLDTGVAAFRKARDLDSSSAIFPMNLSLALETRFEASVRLRDLEEALQICRETLNAVRDDTPEVLPSSLDRLAGLLYCRFKHMGRPEDLEEGISTEREALQLLEENDGALPRVLCNLGVFLQHRYTSGGQLVDLEESITVTQRAILLAGEGSKVYAKACNILAIGLLFRFDHTKHLTDIEEAVSHGEQAVQVLAEGDPALPVHLSNLGVLYTSYFTATRLPIYLNLAIKHQEKAVEMTEDGSISMSFRLGSLAETLHTLFKETRKLAALDRAISCIRKAIGGRLPSMADKSTYSHNLGIFLGERFVISQDIADADDCISTYREVISDTPPGSAFLPNRLANFGQFLLKSHEHTSNTGHLSEALLCFERAAKSQFGPPKKRIDTAREWIEIASTLNHPSLISAYDTAIGLLSVVGGLEQTIEHRHKSLADISSLALEAAAAAFELERIDKAVEWLEEGRCLVWNQLMDLRGPLDNLRSYDEELAERVLGVSLALDKAGSRQNTIRDGLQTQLSVKVASQDATLEHVKLASEWEELLQTIRDIPGFENFLQPATLTDFTNHLPENGPVVIINVHESRCDAIALLAGCDEPIHIPLPDFSFDMAERMREELQDRLISIGIRARSSDIMEITDTDVDTVDRAMKRLNLAPRGSNPDNTFNKILAQLWTCVVEPILDNLGFSPSDNPGRIWWCPTGPLSFLPLHAAGIYSSNLTSGVCLSDFAVSSYTPTVSSLSESWKRSKRDQSRSSAGIALISHSDAKDLPSLPGVAAEIATIQAQAGECGVRTLSLEGEDATTEATMASMEKCHWIHLACHAFQDTSDPLQSGFYLSDDLLRLSTIIKDTRGTQSSAEFAFLSACQTSTGDATLSEEAVHLAAGMLAAGYSSVVATMWSIPDAHAPAVAKHFYEDVFNRGDGSLDGLNTAHALHHAVRSLRDQLGDSPYSFLAWVPYVHFGL